MLPQGAPLDTTGTWAPKPLPVFVSYTGIEIPSSLLSTCGTQCHSFSTSEKALWGSLHQRSGTALKAEPVL